jgi:hypothetical protein
MCERGFEGVCCYMEFEAIWIWITRPIIRYDCGARCGFLGYPALSLGNGLCRNVRLFSSFECVMS